MKTLLLQIFAITFVGLSSAQAVNRCDAILSPDLEELYIPASSGKLEEHSLRNETAAVHIFADSHKQPYVYFAMPEGNTGLGLWFQTAETTAHLQAVSKPRLISEGLFHGAEAELKTGTRDLRIDEAILGSMRFIRDRELDIKAPAKVAQNQMTLVDGRLRFERRSLNGKTDYKIEIEPVGDTSLAFADGRPRLTAPSEVLFRIKAVTTEPSLTPMTVGQTFDPAFTKNVDPKKLREFAFLHTKEKQMAGSPRYFSQFGRDSDISTLVMMRANALRPEAVENVMVSLLSGAHAQTGEMSHERSEGDFVSYIRSLKKQKVAGVDAFLEDRKMVDTDFLFTVLVSEYMRKYPERVDGFLNGHDQRGLSIRGLVAKNFSRVTRLASPFAKDPAFRNLIRLKQGDSTGQWRDSDNGLGGGVYPYDVNAALVPGALKALADVYRTQASLQDPAKASVLDQMANIWSREVPKFFEVRIPKENLAAEAASFAAQIQVPLSELPRAPDQDLLFPAIALDDAGHPIPVMHSDDSLMMMYGMPSAEELRTVSQRLRLPFPYGLYTHVGIVVANPIFAAKELWPKFGAEKYHGQVSWTMQENLLVLGIDRQLARRDLPEDLKHDLRISKETVLHLLRKKAAMGGTEVFAITYRDHDYRAVPFAGDAKSNSNQLWSHLSLAIPELRESSN